MLGLKNIIIQKESSNGVTQWHLNLYQSVILICSLFFVIAALIFISSDYLSNYLYGKRLQEYKANYSNVSKNLALMRTKIDKLNLELEKIEQKDKAVRTYAGMPEIDRSIRQLGIGGHSIESGKFSDNLAPKLNEELFLLEKDLKRISRNVNLELNSYKSIYEKVQDNIQRINSIPSIRPVQSGYLNSTFGYRNDPIDNVRRFHHGQDITVKSGTPILAPANGVVKRAYYAGGFGNHIKIDHGSGYTTLFAHLSKINVKHGQEIKRGEVIGYTGNTGRSTAPHLHYEIHYNGEPQNPLDYFFSDSNH